MQKHTIEPPVASSPTWEHLETALRGRMREWLQDLLDAEVDELLGRRKSARRKAVDSAPGYRSGHGPIVAPHCVQLAAMRPWSKFGPTMQLSSFGEAAAEASPAGWDASTPGDYGDNT